VRLTEVDGHGHTAVLYLYKTTPEKSVDLYLIWVRALFDQLRWRASGGLHGLPMRDWKSDRAWQLGEVRELHAVALFDAAGF